jgi:hypothetical protein
MVLFPKEKLKMLITVICPNSERKIVFLKIPEKIIFVLVTPDL